MKTYLLSATAVIFLSVIVSLIIPEGKLNKTIVFIMRMACIFVLIKPVTGIFKVSSEGTEPVFDYIYICKVYSDNQSEQLEAVLKDKFGVECDCTVSVVYDDEQFKAESVVVATENNSQLIDKIYEYLEEMKYINISVYAKSN